MSDCIFCRIAAGEVPAVKVFENDELLAFRDIRPQAPQHVQIIPKRHIDTIQELGEAEIGLVGRLVLTANRIAKELGVAESGYRLVFNCLSDGGQEVFHIHLHLLGGRQMGWPPG